MTVREMHIEINQSLQQVAANKTRKYLSEELDWVLNKTQHRFVQSCLRPVKTQGDGRYRFADQLRADALRYLVKNKEVTCYVEREGTVQATLPEDYQYLMTDVSRFYLLCGETPTRSTVNLDYHVLKLHKTSAPSAPFYTSGTLQVGGQILNIPSSLGLYNTYAGFQSREDVIFLKDWMLSRLWKLGVEVYWEKYGQVYEPDSLIFPGSLPVPLTLSWDGAPVTAVQSKTVSKLKDSFTGTLKEVDNRILTPYDMSTTYTPYYSPSAQSPVSELLDNRLLVHHDTNTIVDTVFFTYVRKPQPISLSLGSNCELAEDFHQTICDLSTEYILKQIKDEGGAQLKAQDNETRVIL